MIYFWDDIWLGNTPLRELSLDDRGSPSTLVLDFIKDGAWDEPKLQLLHNQAGPPQWEIENILGTPIIPWELDIPRWTLSRLGDFSLASTWEISRRQGPIVHDLDEVWKSGLSSSIQNFNGARSNWHPSVNAVPLGLHQDVRFKAFNVVWHVQMYVRNNIANGNIKPKHWNGVSLRINIPNQVEVRRLQPIVMVKWNPPDRPWIKLNTDGAYIEAIGKAGRGGIIRDHAGKMIVAFATPLNAHSALEAELLAVHFGLTIAKELEQPIWIESDAAQAINLLNGSCWGPVHVRQVMAHLAIHKQQIKPRATFIHREGNKATDLLAKKGLESDNLIRINAQAAPRLLKAIIRLEEMGIPNIRVREEDHG